jgi:predicted Ser/Thr protein kinase
MPRTRDFVLFAVTAAFLMVGIGVSAIAGFGVVPAKSVMSIFERYQARYESSREEDMSLQEYLELCKSDPMAYAGAAERLLAAIGEPELIDTHDDPRLSRIFQNKVIKRYPAFADFYGMEEAIEHLVSYLKHAAQGLEEKKQILYLLGPSVAASRRWRRSSRS